MLNNDALDKWGLNLQVSFRESQALQVLQKKFHSGGECALSTMMMLLAMQESTPMPFRVLDEINQGVSASNERAIIDTLARLFDSVRVPRVCVCVRQKGGSHTAVSREYPIPLIRHPPTTPTMIHSSVLMASLFWQLLAVAQGQERAQEQGRGRGRVLWVVVAVLCGSSSSAHPSSCQTCGMRPQCGH